MIIEQTDIAQADKVVHQLANMLEQAQVARSEIRQSFKSPVRCITIKKFCEVTGYTENAVNAKIRDGVWLEGTIYIKAPDGRRLIDLQEYDLWVQRESKWA